MLYRAPQPTLAPSDFTVGAWLVQPSLNRMHRDDTVVRLRPQLVDVLVCLAERAGRTASREEILQAVWPGQFIVESGLARCIAELRQALGDSARGGSTYIETIPKRGYRLIAPVRFVPETPAASDAWSPRPMPRAASDAAAGVEEEVIVKVNGAPAAQASAESLMAAAPPLALNEHPWWRRTGAIAGPGFVRSAVGAIASWVAWR